MSKKEKLEKVDDVQDVSQEEHLDEAASDTLKPKGGSGGGEGGFAKATKSELLSKMTQIAAAMTKQDLSSFLTKTLDQIGKEDEKTPNAAAANKASVATSGAGVPSPVVAQAVKEDMDELLSGQEEISEDFKEKATTLFEAAVQNRVSLEVARLEEEFETKLDEQVTEAIDELHEQINKYTDYVASEWMKENKVELEASYRAEATEQFIEGLKGLFSEHYVEVPEDKLDVIGELTKKVDDMTEELDKVKAEKIELNKIIESAKIEVAFDEVSEGLVDTEVEKLKSLAEGIEYKDVEEYTEKLKIVREQYFKEDKEDKTGDTGLINEEAIGNNDEADEEPAVVIPEEMKSYVSAISRTSKK
jgi:hypothetical protein